MIFGLVCNRSKEHKEAIYNGYIKWVIRLSACVS